MARCGCTSGCACLIQHLDTDCVDVNITGSGSSIDPYIVSAELDLDPSGGLQCTGSGLGVLVDPGEGNILVVEPDGLFVPTPVTPTPVSLATFAIAGPLSAGTNGTLRYRFPFSGNLVGVSAAVNTAPTGASIILDVNKTGVSLFSINPKPTILAGAFDTGVSEATPDTLPFVSGDYLQVDVDQVGSIIPGSDLTVFVRYSQ